MSGTRFVPRTEAEVRNTLEPSGFKQIWIAGTTEMVFERSTKNKKVRIRVYSAIQPNGAGGGHSRDVGTDAGRVVLVTDGNNRPIWKSKRVHRTKNFLVNLLNRCRDAYKAVADLRRCPKCKGFMIKRYARTGPRGAGGFFGCAQYPKCDGTRSAS